MRIGVSDTLGSEHKFQKYLQWLQSSGQEVETVTLSYRLNNLRELENCHGLLLTGGHDVDPALYDGSAHTTIKSVDRQRDDFEMEALKRALGSKLSILGICRGLQLVNVYFGGTLIPDIEERGYRSHRSNDDSMECRHELIVERNSTLFDMTGCVAGVVNSSHHQAALDLGRGLRAVAHSDDGLIEAIEAEEETGPHVFICVQWHPERMYGDPNPLSSGILKRFLNSMNMIAK